MSFSSLKALQNESTDTGQLKISAVSETTHAPIENAAVSISYTGNPTETIEQLRTDADGQLDTLTLPAPPLEYSMQYGRPQPYSEYTITITAPGYDDFQASGVEVLPLVTALYQAKLTPRTVPAQETIFVIGPHTLYGDYPPKIAENEIKPIDESGEIVLSRVVVPETVIVHDGPPSDRSARDYYVSYKDYIKNVASSEIYATWPEATIRANVLAIMSFTLNRVYTEWYRNHQKIVVK